MREVIANCFVYIIELLIAYMYFSDLFYKRKKEIHIFIIGMALYLSASAVNIVFSNNVFLNLFCFIFINTIFSYVCFEIKIVKSFFHSVILTVLMVLSETAVVFIVSSVLKNEINSYQNDFGVYILDLVFSKTLFVIITKLITKLLPGNTDKTKTPYYMFIYPVCTMIILVIFRVIAIKYSISETLNTGISIISFLLLFSVVVTYFMYANTLKKDAELFELKNELNKIEIDNLYQSILEYQNEEMQTFAHDTKNHFVAIKALANNCAVDEYIDKIYSDLKKYSVTGTTKNKILDLIVNKYSRLCDINNIDFCPIIRTSNLSFIDNADLSALLDNILSNALESAKNSAEKEIELSINKKQSFDTLTCINSCDQNPVSDNGRLITTKLNKNIHGYGTKSIKKIVKKYGGDYSWHYDADNNEFVTNIVFYNN